MCYLESCCTATWAMPLRTNQDSQPCGFSATPLFGRLGGFSAHATKNSAAGLPSYLRSVSYHACRAPRSLASPFSTFISPGAALPAFTTVGAATTAAFCSFALTIHTPICYALPYGSMGTIQQPRFQSVFQLTFPHFILSGGLC